MFGSFQFVSTDPTTSLTYGATLCIAASLAGLMQPGVQAQESEPVSQLAHDIDRFGVGLNGGNNNIGITSLGAVLSYRLPLLDNRLRIVAQYDLNFNAPSPVEQAAWLGVHHDFYSNRELWNLRVFGRLLFGAISTANPSTTPGTSFWIPGFQLGVGAEAQIAGPLWGVAQVSSGFPFLLRPELGLRLAF